MRVKFVIIAIFIFISLITSNSYAQQPLYGDWRLTKIVKDGSEVPLAGEGKIPDLHFEKDTQSFYGTGGCNRFRGSYTLENGKFKAGPVIATKMACIAPALNEQETHYFEIIDKVGTYKMSKGSLFFSDEAG